MTDTTDCVNCGAAFEGRVCWTCGHAQYTGSDTETPEGTDA